MSKILDEAFARLREVRAEYERVRLAAYLRAEAECRGRMLNERGMRAGIDPLSLFSGPEVRALAYASEELVEHWRVYPRLTFERFERVSHEAQWQH